MIDYTRRFARDPRVCGGQTVIAGTRVPLRTVLASLAEGAGIDEILEDVTPHTLRHSFVKDALGAGMDVVTVAALLGHENLRTTMIYTRPSEDELQVAIERIGVA